MHLAVTVIAGLRDAPKQKTLRALGFRAADVEIDPEAHDDYSLLLAERLVARAQEGARGTTLVDAPAGTDPVELALVLPRVFESWGSDVHLAAIVAVTTAADVRTLLFRDPAAEESSVGLPEQLALQVEFATVVVVADAASISPAHMLEVRGLLSKINPAALQLELTSTGALRRLGPARSRASVEALGRSVGWMLELSGLPLPTIVHGVGCVVYRDPRPFHPVRLAAGINDWLEPAEAGLIVRSRGLVRLATRPDRIGSWSTAGEVLALDPTAMKSWDENSPPGQELVFFGLGLNRDYITRVLDSCLLSDDELVAGPMEWETYYDPFPAWNFEHGH